MLIILFCLEGLDKKKRNGYFVQDGGTEYTANYSINI
jgi:hypothetical protein